MAPCSLTDRLAAASRSRCEASSSEPWNICSRRLRPLAPRQGIVSPLHLVIKCATIDAIDSINQQKMIITNSEIYKNTTEAL